MWRNMVERGR